MKKKQTKTLETKMVGVGINERIKRKSVNVFLFFVSLLDHPYFSGTVMIFL